MNWFKRTRDNAARHIDSFPWVYYATLLIIYSAAAILLPTIEGGVFLCSNDFGGVFLPSARYILAGQPLDMYQVRVGIYPNANGPVGEFLIAGIIWAGRLLHLQTIHPLCTYTDNYPLFGDSVPLRMWISLVTSWVFMGIAYGLTVIVETVRSRTLPHSQRLLILTLLLISPPMWDSIVFYGHYEQIFEILLTLLAIHFYLRNHMIISGFLLGLAILNRTAVIFIIIPLFIALLLHKYWQQLVLLGTVMGGTVAIVLIPFMLHDKANVVYSLGQFRSQEPILDGSFWTIFRFTSLEPHVQSWDSTVGIALATLIAIIMIWRQRIAPNSIEMYRVIFATSLCFALTLKAVWGYYFTEPLVWGAAWALSESIQRVQWLKIWLNSVIFTLLMLFTEARISYVGDVFHEEGMQRMLVIGESTITMLTLLALLIVLFWRPSKQEIVRKKVIESPFSQ